MGYRPRIKCGKYIHEFGKFYGYVNLENLKSTKWLLDHNKLDEYGLDNFTFNIGPTIDFTADEFREFIDLYQEDINGYDFSKYRIYYEPNFKMSEHWSDFDEVYNNNDPVTIDWG